MSRQVDQQADRHDGPSRVVIITGASSGFGRLAAESLAHARLVVAAGLRPSAPRNASNAAVCAALTADESLDLSAIETDIQDQGFVEAAIETTLQRSTANSWLFLTPLGRGAQASGCRRSRRRGRDRRHRWPTNNGPAAVPKPHRPSRDGLEELLPEHASL